MTLTGADKIRSFVDREYITPARARGQSQVTIRAGDVHSRMNLKNRVPSVCGALGAHKFSQQFNLELANREGPDMGANASFTFSILPPAGKPVPKGNAKVAMPQGSVPARTTAEFGELRRNLNKILDQVGAKDSPKESVPHRISRLEQAGKIPAATQI